MIEIRRVGKGFKAVALIAGKEEVHLFNACLYETAVHQAHVRDGHVVFEGIKLEAPRKMTRAEREEMRWVRRG